TESRITIVNGTTPTPVHLNQHINYNVIPGPPAEIAQTLAFPTDLTFSTNGAIVFVAALGSRKIAALDAASLESGAIVGGQVDVGNGPSGVAFDDTNDR